MGCLSIIILTLGIAISPSVAFLEAISQHAVGGSPASPCGPGRRMCTSVKKCVPLSRVCDGVDDCGDNSDERSCGAARRIDISKPCGPGRQMCWSLKKCLPVFQRCPRRSIDPTARPPVTVVPDGPLTTSPCGPGRRMCKSLKKCVPLSSFRMECPHIDPTARPPKPSLWDRMLEAVSAFCLAHPGAWPCRMFHGMLD